MAAKVGRFSEERLKFIVDDFIQHSSINYEIIYVQQTI